MSFFRILLLVINMVMSGRSPTTLLDFYQPLKR